MKTTQPLLIVFCGPNGAGKSTFRQIALEGLPIPFVNADEIALREFGPTEAAARSYEAAQIAEAVRLELFAARRSFCFETVLSDPHGAKVDFLRQAKASGYHVAAHFIGLESAEHSKARVIQRVHTGGHDVPDDKLAARFPRVLENLQRLLDVPDELVIYDNSSSETPYRVIARLNRGVLLEIADTIPDWALLLGLPARQTPQTRVLP
jgi:predicted ABC-type ATPase